MDEPRMMASHEVNADPMMTPEEAKAIIAHYKGKPPEALWAKLKGPEKETLMGAMDVSAGVPGLSPGLVGGAIGLGAKALKYAPSLGKAGRFAAGGAGAVVGGEGAKKLWHMTGLPGEDIVGMIGAMAGGHLGSGGGGGATTAAEGAAEGGIEAALGKLKRSTSIQPETGGWRDAPRTGARPVPNTSEPFPVPNTSPFKPIVDRSNTAIERGKTGDGGLLGSPDTAGLRQQPNVSVTRNVGDIAEQVKRGVQNDFKGTVSLKRPSTPSPRSLSPGEEQGVKDLGELMDATGSQVKGNGTYKPSFSEQIDGLREGKKSKSLAREPGEGALQSQHGKPESASDPTFQGKTFDKNKFIRHEFPPGTSSKTKPNVFEQASRDYADSQTDPDAFAAAQSEINKALDAHYRKSKLKR